MSEPNVPQTTVRAARGERKKQRQQNGFLTPTRRRRDPRWNYAKVLFVDTGATLEGLREAVTTLEETSQTARRVLGGSHPLAAKIEQSLRNARAVLRARETQSSTSA